MAHTSGHQQVWVPIIKLCSHVVISDPDCLLGDKNIGNSVNVFGKNVVSVASKNVWQTGEQLVANAQNIAQTTQNGVNAGFISGSDVPQLVPYLYKIASKSKSSAEHDTNSNLVLFVSGHLENLVCMRETGFVIVVASNGTQFMDLSIIACTMASREGLPVCVWLDQEETSTTLGFESPLYSLNPDEILALFKRGEEKKSLETKEVVKPTAKAIPGEEEKKRGASELFEDFTSCKGTTGHTMQKVLSGRHYSSVQYTGNASATLVVVAFPDAARVIQEYTRSNTPAQPIGVIAVHLVRPWSAVQFLAAIPKTAQKIHVLDEVSSDPPALFLDVAGSFHSHPEAWMHPNIPELVPMKYRGGVSLELARQIVTSIFTKEPLEFDLPSIKSPQRSASDASQSLRVAKPYLQMLHTAFGSRLRIEDASSAHSVEAIFGEYVAQIRSREMFAEQVLAATKNSQGSSKLKETLRLWYACRAQATMSTQYGEAAIKLLEQEIPNTPHLVPLYEQRLLFPKLALWILGSENWANDLQQSGIHHVISSGVDVNVLLLDTQVYPSKAPSAKKDVGLYAMNYGNTYVASVAIYNNYTHVLHSLLEAEVFGGPSIVLAYLPSDAQSDQTNTKALDAIQVMKDSKIAVDSGVWPLYRWNPDQHKRDGKGFTLESDRIKAELKAFLDKENELSLIINQIPDIPLATTNALEVRMTKLEESFSKLAAGVAPLLILYGSDTGHAESLAKKMEARGKRNKRNARAMPMDDLQPSDLINEPTVLFIVATGGQGEFPANSKEFWKTIHKLSINDLNLEKMNYSVFGLGDSRYWPSHGGEIYFCKPSKELDSKLEDLGAKKFHPLGLGDDQDTDGYLTGFALWEPQIWEYLGVSGDAGAAPTITDDQNKLNSNFLRGKIAEGLADLSTGALPELDTKILKFHGSYMQDDRDLRDSRKAQGLEKAYSFMVRLRIPGGIITPQQYLALDDIAGEYASTTIRLTTRQTIQYHGIIKKNLRAAMQAINKALLDTIAACGDVNRNVLCISNPALASTDVHQELVDLAVSWASHMLPKTGAYREIWLEDKLVKGGEENTVQDFEPIYGPTYLPRKFKTVFTVPPYNDVDIFAHDLGYIAIIENDKIVGYNVTVGGGMGMSHGNKKTFPRLADVLGFIEKNQVIAVGEQVVKVQRDYGDRKNRKHARLKYTIEDHGVDWFRNEVEIRLGFKLQPARPFYFTDNSDRYGWVQGNNKKWHYTMFIQNGRVKDSYDYPLRTGLRELAKIHKGDFRFTANQNVIISNVDEQDKDTIEKMMEKYNIANKRNSSLRLNSMACVALPTCGLAFAESERYLPSLITAIDDEITALGLWEEPITIRMTGCPNGCARPYISEIGLVGKAPGIYNLYIGGGFAGQRLNKLYKEAANEKEILEALKPLLQKFAKEKLQGEHFGDFVIRTGFIKPVLISNTFHD